MRWRGHDKSIQKSQVRETGHHLVCSGGGVKLIAKVAQRLLSWLLRWQPT